MNISSGVHRKNPRGGSKGPFPQKFLENIVIFCFERRFSKQNSVIRLKLNILLYTAEYCFYIFLFLGSEGRAMPQWPPPPYASGHKHIAWRHSMCGAWCPTDGFSQWWDSNFKEHVLSLQNALTTGLSLSQSPEANHGGWPNISARLIFVSPTGTVQQLKLLILVFPNFRLVFRQKGARGVKLRTNDLSQQPVLGIK